MDFKQGLKSLRALWESILAVLLGLLAAMIFLWASGYNPIDVLYRGFGFSLFTRHGFFNTLASATPLILTAITWAVGVKAGLFNVGAEGIMMMGAGATVAVGALTRLPPGLHHLIALAAALVAGSLWILPVSFLKIKRNVHEVVSTIMLNWVAIFLLSFCVVWPLRDPDVPWRTLKMLPSARFAALVKGSSLTDLIFLSIAVAIFTYFLLRHTRVGQHIRATGLNPDTARNAGIDIARATVLGFVIGGASAGLAGYTLTAGLPPLWTISDKLGTLAGYGFSGIVVAAIARNHPIGCIFAAILFGAVMTSQTYIQIFSGVPPEITDVIAGVIIIVLALPGISKTLLLWRRRRTH